MVSNAEQTLTKQLPEYFRPVPEFQEIMKAQGYALDILEYNICRVEANNYISTCDERKIADYEKRFGMVYRFGDTLDYRRARVLQKFNTIIPFSIAFLENKLIELYGKDGYRVVIDFTECIIGIRITSDRYGAIDLLYDLLWDVVPAHIQIIANQETTNQIGGSKLYTAGFVTNTFIQTIGG